MRSSARVLFLVTVACLPSFAQSKGGGTTTGTPTVPTPTNPTIPTTTTPNINTTTTPTNTIPQIPRPIFVSGRVAMEDGSPPPSSVTIMRVCNGNQRAMGYADGKGNFSFDLNHSEAAFQDASIAGAGNITGDPSRNTADTDLFSSQSRTTANRMDPGDTNLVGCELRAQLAGYRSTAVDLGMRRTMDNPDVGTILLHRIGKDEGGTVSMTSMLAPKDAKKAYDKGLDSLKKKKPEVAEQEFQKAVASYPKFADAWFRLGMLQLTKNDVPAAKSSFQNAIAADPKLVTPYIEMAILLSKDNKWQEAADSSGKAIHLDPIDFPIAYYFDALANYNLQNWDAAEKSARQLVKLDTRHQFVMVNRIPGAVLAEKKDYPGAAQQMRNYLQFAGAAKDADEVRGQLQQLEKMNAEAAATKDQ